MIDQDQALLRAGLSWLFEDAGHEVVAAVGDADRLRGAVSEQDPDLAVVDVRIPPSSKTRALVRAVDPRFAPNHGACMFAPSGHGSHITMEQPIGTIWILRDGLIRRGFGFLNVNDIVDSMAAQCGRDRAEIESLVDEAKRARASPKSGGA